MDSNTSPQPTDTPPDSRGVSVPARDQSVAIPNRGQDATANVLRDRIHNIYETNPPNQPAASQETTANPYKRTLNTDDQQQNWQQYHSAWQQYYQQYYQRYYLQQLHVQRQQQHAAKSTQAAALPQKEEPKQIIAGSNPDAPKQRAELTSEFKQQLLNKVQTRAKKLRHSHHFMPLMSALAVGVLFLFLQFNRVMIAEVKAYVSPGNLTNDSLIVEPTANTNVSPEPKLIIPKINVDVPVVYGIQSLEDKPVQEALHGGVVHYPLPGANAVPGQVGNAVILGHSSNDVFDAGAYKFAFVLLERLQKEDVFYINYQGKRFIYRVTEKKVITPSELDSLRLNTTKPMATLVTCTPPGTALARLIVIAEQISPDPTGANVAAENPATAAPKTLPGYSPTFIERVIDFFTN